MYKLLPVAVAAAILAPAAAHAQPQEPAAVPFGTMDRADTVSNAGVSTAVLLFTGEDDNVTGMRLDFWGQYVHETGLGAMIQMPFSFVFEDEADPGIGDLEIGPMYVAHLDPDNDLIVRLGIAVPTASDDFESALSNIFGVYARITDTALVSTEAVIRPGGSYVTRAGSLIGRVDIGLDIVADKDVKPLFRANVAGGTYIGETGVFLVEVVNLISTDPDLDDHSIHSIAVTGGAASGIVSGSFIIPIEEDVTGDIWGFMLRAGGSF